MMTAMPKTIAKLTADIQKILEARHYDPFSILGKHQQGNDEVVVRVFIPEVGSDRMRLLPGEHQLQRLPNTDVFEWRGKAHELQESYYQLQWQDSQGQTHTAYDPYSFPPQ